MSDSYQPRPHDHLVEPLYGGLGPVTPPPVSTPRRILGRAAPLAVLIALVLAALLALWLTR